MRHRIGLATSSERSFSLGVILAPGPGIRGATAGNTLAWGTMAQSILHVLQIHNRSRGGLVGVRYLLASMVFALSIDRIQRIQRMPPGGTRLMRMVMKIPLVNLPPRETLETSRVETSFAQN